MLWFEYWIKNARQIDDSIFLNPELFLLFSFFFCIGRLKFRIELDHQCYWAEMD
jgi:hypothetical protein